MYCDEPAPIRQCVTYWQYRYDFHPLSWLAGAHKLDSSEATGPFTTITRKRSIEGINRSALNNAYHTTNLPSWKAQLGWRPDWTDRQVISTYLCVRSKALPGSGVVDTTFVPSFSWKLRDKRVNWVKKIYIGAISNKPWIQGLRRTIPGLRKSTLCA